MVSFGTPPPLKRGSGVLFFAAKKVLRKNGRLFWMLALRLIRSRNNRKRCNIFDCLQIRQFGALLFQYDRRIYRPADDRIHQDFARRCIHVYMVDHRSHRYRPDQIHMRHPLYVHTRNRFPCESARRLRQSRLIGIQMGFFFYNAAACTTDFFMGRIISGIMISGTAFCLFFVDISTEDTYWTVHSCSGDLFPTVEFMIAGDLRFWCCRLRCWCRCRHWGWSGRRW